MMGVDGDPVVWSAQAVRSPDREGRNVEAHTAGMADDMLKGFAGLDGVSETQNRYEACRVVWCAHIAATGSSTSSDGIALAPDGGPWRSSYRNAVSGRKPFSIILFFSALVLFFIFFSAGGRTLNLRFECDPRSGQVSHTHTGRGGGNSMFQRSIVGFVGIVVVYRYIFCSSADGISGIITSIDLSMHTLDLVASKQGI